MAFFYNSVKGTSKPSVAAQQRRHIPIESMNQMGCKVCPLDKADIDNPKMEASGSNAPDIYFLGESPNQDAAADGDPFDRAEEKLLRSQFSDGGFSKKSRSHNIIRCHKPGFTKGFPSLPELAETECCRGFIASDIEKAQPLVVVGGGAAPLTWATGLSGGITKWRGKLIATRIGKHVCWYFPIFHPSHVLNKRNKWGKSEVELVFENDLQTLIDLVDSGQLQPPTLYEKDFDKGYELITGESSSDFNKLEDLLNRIAKFSKCGIDIETVGLRPYPKHGSNLDPVILTCALGSFNEGVAFPLDHPEGGWTANTRRRVWGLVGEFLLQSGKKIAHNLAFEQEWLLYHFGDPRILRLTEWADTMAQAHTLDERPGKSLGDLTRQHLGFDLKSKSTVDTKRLLEFPLISVLRYNGMDAKWVNPLYEIQAPMIQELKPYVVEYNRKIRLCPTLVMTQHKGMCVDFDYAEEMKEKLDAELAVILAKIAKCPEVKEYEKKFKAFNPASPEDVIKLMRDICHREEVQKSDGGESGDEEVLSKIPASEVPSAPLILEFRGVAKLLSTYVNPIIDKKIVGLDNRVHTSYSSMRAVSGRLASEDPNIQNWPARKHKEIKGIICCPDGHWFIACDYGQIEARVIAMASEDPNLVKYLWSGYDIHGYWADRFLKLYPEIADWIIADVLQPGWDKKGDPDVTIRKAMRQEAKNKWVFPQFFGSDHRSCARNLNTPDSVTEELSGEFWDEFAGVKIWQEKLLKKYEKNLYVETLDGRRRRGVMTKNEIINHPIQGSAASIVLAAMCDLSEKSLTLDDSDLQPVFNGHDDLSFYLPDQGLESKLEIITTEMCRHRFDYINVPLIVEVKGGHHWHDLNEIGVYKSNEIFNMVNPYEH